MPAFTYSCSKIDISVSEDCVTVFPNHHFLKRYGPNSRGEFEITTTVKDTVFPDARNLIEGKRALLNRRGFTQINDRDEAANLREPYHLQCDTPIDQAKLAILIGIFYKHNIIRIDEKSAILSAFRRHNGDFSTLTVNQNYMTTLFTPRLVNPVDHEDKSFVSAIALD